MIPQIIQGGMGVAISNYVLANAVSREGGLGVVSGTGIGLVLIGRLMDGDEGGHVRRALAEFPFQDVAERLIKDYYLPEGRQPKQGYKRPTLWTINPPQELNELTVAANFVEVWLAKEGHANPVGINLLEKVQLPNLSSLYGAMLAGVDVVIMGAGVPIQVPGVLDKLMHHQAVSYRLDVLNAGDAEYAIHFDPCAVFPSASSLADIKRPDFLPIISSVILAQALIKRSTGPIQGFVIETPIAGGHNAPPRGQVQYNELGEPIYGERDIVDLSKMRALNYPFWLAGGYGTPEKLREALAEGASGIQVGTAFAYCDDSGMEAGVRQHIIGEVLEGTVTVKTDALASPTGFPFKVVQVDGTLSDPAIYGVRDRICDIGYLRHLVRGEDGDVIYRCPAAPIEGYVRNGGALEDTVGRQCLCNSLGAAAGFAQTRRQATYTEPVLITSGDDVVHLGQYLPEGATHYSARDVLEYLRGN
jgi:NAD(P)H-dependent flavin oxidoreductase YrpB (nitropropane dioxygenase family)